MLKFIWNWDPINQHNACFKPYDCVFNMVRKSHKPHACALPHQTICSMIIHYVRASINLLQYSLNRYPFFKCTTIQLSKRSRWVIAISYRKAKCFLILQYRITLLSVCHGITYTLVIAIFNFYNVFDYLSHLFVYNQFLSILTQHCY